MGCAVHHAWGRTSDLRIEPCGASARAKPYWSRDGLATSSTETTSGRHFPWQAQRTHPQRHGRRLPGRIAI
jgi:hypothetical protein